MYLKDPEHRENYATDLCLNGLNQPKYKTSSQGELVISALNRLCIVSKAKKVSDL